MRTCHCGNVPLSLEVRTPGRNRGRWYQRCPTGTCRFFAWDESPYPFIRHPLEVYSSIKSRINTRPSYFSAQSELRESRSAIPQTKIPVAFSILSKQLIGIKTEANLTLEPVFAGIENVKWSDEHDQWTIPATVPMYNLAISSLPTEIPNLQLEIETIPPAILDSIIEMSLLEANARMQDPSEMTEIEFRWSEFVESKMYRLLTPAQRNGVLFGLERCGRVLFGNENGVGTIGQVLALTQVYQDEWPVLVTCPNILCHTWKHEIKKWLGLSDNEICILDPKIPAREMFKQETVKKRKKHARTKFRQKDDIDHVSNIKFYITTHQNASKRRRELRVKDFKIVVCTDSHYLNTLTTSESKFLSQLLQKHRRIILTSDSIRYRKPLLLYSQINTILPTVFTDFESYAKRYCDSKAAVFGYNNFGESNTVELNYLLDANVWYTPKLEQLKPDFPAFVRQEVIFSIKKSNTLKCQTEDIISMGNNCDIVDEELVETLHEKTGEIKKEHIIQYFNHVFEMYKRPKIAVFYHNASVYKAIEEHLNAKKKPLTHLDNIHNSNSICEEYNQSHSVQFIFLDMKMCDLDVSLHSVDLVIFTELPFERERLSIMESLFKFNERKGPLSIKYLIALQTIDDYLWPLVKT
ncbi:hypothetical protein INT48_000781 [Thamnidium elegans]|uniref:GRF-type domain-containing protein n=1 Tax=Thamnidium elegans TaxID=101142 RepID=A0A8H7STX2_9FUNG|nr:hypothetical protein INT48_000781 [Thamnidium elegans]